MREEAASTEPEKLKVNWYLVAASVITIYGLWSLWRQPWLAGPDSHIVWVTVVGIMCCWILIAWEVGRMWHIWTHLETLHRTAARLPMQHVYEHLPESICPCVRGVLFCSALSERDAQSRTPSAMGPAGSRTTWFETTIQPERNGRGPATIPFAEAQDRGAGSVSIVARSSPILRGFGPNVCQVNRISIRDTRAICRGIAAGQRTSRPSP